MVACLQMRFAVFARAFILNIASSAAYGQQHAAAAYPAAPYRAPGLAPHVVTNTVCDMQKLNPKPRLLANFEYQTFLNAHHRSSLPRAAACFHANPSLPPPYKQATTQNVKGTNVFIQNM